VRARHQSAIVTDAVMPPPPLRAGVHGRLANTAAFPLTISRVRSFQPEISCELSPTQAQENRYLPQYPFKNR
jgi:hypothetical protein